MKLERLAGADLSEVLAKVRSGVRLSGVDFRKIWETCDLTGLGTVANFARERATGGQTTYRYQLHLNYTGRPVAACPECDALSRSGSFRSSIEDLCQAAVQDSRTPKGEIHLAGGTDAGNGAEDLLILAKRVRALDRRFHLRAFSWDELIAAAQKDGQQPARVLAALVKAGIDSLAGGVLADLTPENPHTARAAIERLGRYVPWIGAAADLGLRSEFVWVVGDGDDPEALADLLTCVRGLQDRWNIFECCTPLLFQSRLEGAETPMPTGYNQLRAVAAARLFLDNIPYIRSPIAAIGESVAQVAQWYGANDIGGIPFPAGGGNGNAILPEAGQEAIVKLIQSTGRTPVNPYTGA